MGTDTGAFWIGGSRPNPGPCTPGLGPYSWSDGTPYNYTNYAPTEPSCTTAGGTMQEACISYMADANAVYPNAKGYWNDFDCSTVLRGYLCEKNATMT